MTDDTDDDDEIFLRVQEEADIEDELEDLRTESTAGIGSGSQETEDSDMVRVPVEVDGEETLLTPDDITDLAGYDEQQLEDQRAVLEPTRLKIMQTILATEWGSLSAPEIAVRVSVSESTVRDRLREMVERERPFVKKYVVAEEAREQNVPWTFFGVTEYGADLLKEVGMYDVITALYQLYSRLDYGEEADRIRRIEKFENRPNPDWL